MNNKKRPVRITGERELSFHLGNPEHHDKIAGICRAMSSPIRLKILDILKATVMSVQEIAQILDIPVSSAALYIRMLEEVGLIVTETQPGMHGSMRVCTLSMHSFYLQAYDAHTDSLDNTLEIDIPVGDYHGCDVQPSCGMADENGIINAYDEVKSFYFPQRINAQLLWFHKGYIEYRFPNIDNPLLDLHELSFSLEICSEAPGFHENWPSDITVSINNTKVSTYCCPGDFGARRGKLTPASWSNGRSQYGILKTFSIRKDGGYEDCRPVNRNISLEQLDLSAKPYISLKIEICEDAKNIGGINIFGAMYGDYPQGIVMRLLY